VQLDLNNNVSEKDAQLLKAIEAVRSGTMSIHSASKTFNVPYKSLYIELKKLGIKSRFRQKKYNDNINDEQLKIIVSEFENSKITDLQSYLKMRNISMYALVKKLMSAYKERNDMVKRQQQLLQSQKVEIEVQAETIKDLRDKLEDEKRKQKQTKKQVHSNDEVILLKAKVRTLEHENNDLKRELETLRRWVKRKSMTC